MISETSKAAFDSIRKKLPEKRRAVFVAIMEMTGGGEPVSQVAVAFYMRIPINEVTGRFHELERDGAIERVEFRQDISRGFYLPTFRYSPKKIETKTESLERLLNAIRADNERLRSENESLRERILEIDAPKQRELFTRETNP